MILTAEIVEQALNKAYNEFIGKYREMFTDFINIAIDADTVNSPISYGFSRYWEKFGESKFNIILPTNIIEDREFKITENISLRFCDIALKYDRINKKFLKIFGTLYQKDDYSFHSFSIYLPALKDLQLPRTFDEYREYIKWIKL